LTDKIGITIIGAGVVGCAVACEVSRIFDGDIVVIEKNPQINGENQSSRNSGVLHAGIYYQKDLSPLKARLCVEGNNLMYGFCEENRIPCRKTGKLVVATEDIELEYLNDVVRISRENGVENVRLLSKNEINDFEPNVRGIAAAFVPSSGIIDPAALVEKLFKLAEENGVIFLTETKVTDIVPENESFVLNLSSRTGSEEFRTGICINCAGLYSDIIARMVNPQSSYEMDPVKGDSAKFYSAKRENIGMSGFNVYPVPFGYYPDGERAMVPFSKFLELFRENKVTRSVGVHLSPVFETGSQSININTITMGPAYSKPENREDYRNARNEEYFYNMVKPYFPNIRIDDIGLHQTGIRAKLKNHNDFVIGKDPLYPNFINLIGIDSPGLTSSLAIARYVRNLVVGQV
jgi:L-2-hydroxyglutarate oxidase LhgO